VASSSRTIYQMGKDGYLPAKLSSLNSHHVPWLSTLMAAFLIAIAFITPSFIYLADLATFGFVYSYLFVGPSLIGLRSKGYRGRFRAPLYPIFELIMFALTFAFLLTFSVSVLIEAGVALLLIGSVYVFQRKSISQAEGEVQSGGGEAS